MTQLLLKLLGARAEDAVHIAKASLAFRGGLGTGWFVLWLLVCGGLVWWMYRNSPVTLPPWRRYTLTALRLVFVGLLLVLLLRPVLAFTVEGSVRRVLVMLLDASSSMQIKDPRLDQNDLKRSAIALGQIDPAKGLTQTLDASKARSADLVERVQLVKGVLENAQLDLLPRLDREFDLAAFSFGQGLAELSTRKTDVAPTNSPAKKRSDKKASVEQFDWVDRLKADSPVTAMGDAIREALNRKRGQPLGGIVLITDGANNSGSPPRDAALLARQEGVPLYIYGVGITSPRDIIVGNIFAPEVTFVKDEVPVTVRVRSQGLAGESAELLLKLGGETVAQQNVTLSNDGEQVVPMRFTPQTAGEFELTASIEPRADEVVKDNNSRSHRLKVIDAKIKTLLVDQSPRWEFRYLQAMLMRDRRIDLKCFLVESDKAIARVEGSPYLPDFPARKDELYQYDLIVLGDVDPKVLSPAQQEALSEWVSRFGGALVVVAGKRFSPQAYRRSALEKLLPVEFEGPTIESQRDAISEKPIRLELTAAGRNSAMLRLSDKDDENVALWKQLPPLYWVAKVSRAKPAAEVLLVDPDPARESRFGKMPVVAVQQYGLGQVMYVGTDNTWRWRKNVGDLYYTTLWGQIAQRVSIQRLLGVSKRVQLSADRQNYVTGDRVSIFGRLYGPGFEPVTDPAVKAYFGLKNGTGPRPEVMLRAVPEQAGLYRAEFVAPSPGAYLFWLGDDQESQVDFNVAEPKFELGETAMNEALLRDLAATTGGAFFREEDLHKLPETISAKTERVRSPLEVEIWSSPLFFLLLLGVVTAEWILRKMSHLK